MTVPPGRVAIVSHAHPLDSKGGGEIAAYAIFRGLREIGVDAIFIAARPRGAGKLPKQITGDEFVIRYDPAKYDFLYQLSASGVPEQLCRLFTEQDVAVANFHHFWNFGVNAIEAALSRTAAIGVFTFHEYLAICANDGQMITRSEGSLCPAASPVGCSRCFPQHSPMQFHLRRHVIQRALFHARGFISPSRFLADRMIQWGLPASRMAVIENGLSPQLEQDVRSAEFRQPEHIYIFGYFGQITPYKGIDTLLSAVELLAERPALAGRIRIRIYGDFGHRGEEHRPRLEQCVKQYDFLTYEGAYDNADVGTLMAVCDYVVVPSVWWENSPIVIQEAYQARRSVICSAIGGMAEKVVDGVTGLHFRPGDAEDLLRVFDYAAAPEILAGLTEHLPAVKSHVEAAAAYMEAFDMFGGLEPLEYNPDSSIITKAAGAGQAVATLVRSGDDARGAGRAAEAETAYRDALAIDPAAGWALVGLGRLASARGEHGAALDYFKAGVATDPNNPSLAIQLADALYALSRFDEAEPIYRSAIGTDSDNGWAHWGLARILCARGDPAGAKIEFERAASALTDDWLTLEFAAFHRNQGDFDEAQRFLSTLLAAKPTFGRAWLELGLLERSRGAHDQAIAAFSQGLQLDPDSIDLLIEQSISCRLAGDATRALANLDRAAEIEPDHVRVLLEQAEVAWLSGDVAASVLRCKRAIERYGSENVWPHVLAGRALADMGSTDAAIEALDEGIRMIGARPELVARKLNTLRLSCDWQRAESFAGQFRDLAGRDFAVWYECASLCIDRADYDGFAVLSETVPATPALQQSRVFFLRGRAMERQWRLDDAAALYREGLRINKDDLDLHTALFHLSLLSLDLDAARDHLLAATTLAKGAAILWGASTRPSQSFFGQLYEEFVMDREAAEQLAELNRLSANERTSPALSIAAGNPDHTPSAILACVAMRQAGLFEVSASPLADGDTAQAIPQKIVQYWDESPPPAEIDALMQSWRIQNPSYGYRLFNDLTAQEYLARHLPPPVLLAYRRSRHPAQKADVFRLAYLLIEGGIYVDADDRCLAPIGMLIPPVAQFAIYQEEFGSLGNNFIGAVPKHPIIARALLNATVAINRGDRETMWLLTGPGLLTRAVVQLLSSNPTFANIWSERRWAIFDSAEIKRFVRCHTPVLYKHTKHWMYSAVGAKTNASSPVTRSAPEPSANH